MRPESLLVVKFGPYFKKSEDHCSIERIFRLGYVDEKLQRGLGCSFKGAVSSNLGTYMYVCMSAFSFLVPYLCS
jgi:hypothetical protein